MKKKIKKSEDGRIIAMAVIDDDGVRYEITYDENEQVTLSDVTNWLESIGDSADNYRGAIVFKDGGKANALKIGIVDPDPCIELDDDDYDELPMDEHVRKEWLDAWNNLHRVIQDFRREEKTFHFLKTAGFNEANE